MFLVKRVNGFGSHRSIFSFIQTACASRMPKRENPLDGCPSSMRYRDSILRESNIFNQNVSPWNQIQTTLRTSTRTWKGRSKRLFFSKLDPACIRESRSHPRERERERFLVFTLVILRAISLYSGRTSGKGRGRSWRRSENRRREERNVEYDGAAVKQTGMLQNQYLLDTRRYSTLNASLVTRARTNTRMPLTLCPPLLCDTAEAAVATFRSLHLYIRKTVVSRPETWISFSIIPAR